jgi:hypothetical protein
MTLVTFQLVVIYHGLLLFKFRLPVNDIILAPEYHKALCIYLFFSRMQSKPGCGFFTQNAKNIHSKTLCIYLIPFYLMSPYAHIRALATTLGALHLYDVDQWPLLKLV